MYPPAQPSMLAHSCHAWQSNPKTICPEIRGNRVGKSPYHHQQTTLWVPRDRRTSWGGGIRSLEGKKPHWRKRSLSPSLYANPSMNKKNIEIRQEVDKRPCVGVSRVDITTGTRMGSHAFIELATRTTGDRCGVYRLDLCIYLEVCVGTTSRQRVHECQSRKYHKPEPNEMKPSLVERRHPKGTCGVLTLTFAKHYPDIYRIGGQKPKPDNALPRDGYRGVWGRGLPVAVSVSLSCMSLATRAPAAASNIEQTRYLCPEAQIRSTGTGDEPEFYLGTHCHCSLQCHARTSVMQANTRDGSRAGLLQAGRGVVGDEV
ncbi:hypothetical protein C8F04DRAFT_1196703 [Mycena alexandri]|uniref:Uncharacterized protein n=1 Tax=Mycena alexandri TaxID=1745969 RepID=A0AAD6S4J2_9AGAR|nr:hypothetical protein C8F04DRAFT_1196703 [Mycena alexandri]